MKDRTTGESRTFFGPAVVAGAGSACVDAALRIAEEDGPASLLACPCVRRSARDRCVLLSAATDRPAPAPAPARFAPAALWLLSILAVGMTLSGWVPGTPPVGNGGVGSTKPAELGGAALALEGTLRTLGAREGPPIKAELSIEARAVASSEASLLMMVAPSLCREQLGESANSCSRRGETIRHSLLLEVEQQISLLKRLVVELLGLHERTFGLVRKEVRRRKDDNLGLL